MNRRHWQTIITGALLLALGASSAVAQQRADNERVRASNNPGADANSPAIVAVAPNARLAALIRRDLVVVRNLGVQNVTRPAVGVYCIKPTAASGVDPSSAIVTLSPEFFYSTANNIQVQWASRGSGCVSSRIGLYTMIDNQFSNGVSFSIVVP